MKKKFTARLLAALLATTFLLFACSTGGADGSDAPDSSDTLSTPASSQDQEIPPTSADYGDTGGLILPVVAQETTLTFMLASDVDGLSQKPVYDAFAERTNVRLDMQAVPKANYADKLSIVMGSGSLPDIIANGGLNLGSINTFGSQGAFEPVNNHIDQMPNFKGIFFNDPENNWMPYSFSDNQGNLYTLPTYRLNREVNHGYLYRADIFEELGIQPWTTQEEFYDALVALKTAYPDSYPYSSKNGESFFQREGVSWEINPSEFHFDNDTEKWSFTYTDPKFKAMIDFWKKCYSAELLDPEFMTNTQDAWTAKLTNDQAFVTHDWIGRLDLINGQMADTRPDFDLRYGRPIGPTGRFNTLESFSFWGICIARGKNAETAMKFLDYMYSPSGSELFTIGVEGDMFTWDDNNKPVYPALGDSFIDIHLLEETFGLWVEGAYVHPDRRSVYYNYSEREQQAQDLIIDNNLFYAANPKPKYTDEESTELADITTSLVKSGITFAAKYVSDPAYGEPEWEAWLVEAEGLGSKRGEEIHNQAQANYEEYLKG